MEDGRRWRDSNARRFRLPRWQGRLQRRRYAFSFQAQHLFFLLQSYFPLYTALERLYFSILHRRRSLLWLQRQQRAIIEVVENTKQSLLYGREREPTRQIFENNGGKLYCYLAVLQFKLKMATGFAFKFKLQRLNIWPVAT